LEKASKKMKKWADKKRRPREFQVGDLVLVKMYNHARLAIDIGASFSDTKVPSPSLRWWERKLTRSNCLQRSSTT